jgi:hypothetical protein
MICNRLTFSMYGVSSGPSNRTETIGHVGEASSLSEVIVPNRVPLRTSLILNLSPCFTDFIGVPQRFFIRASVALISFSSFGFSATCLLTASLACSRYSASLFLCEGTKPNDFFTHAVYLQLVVPNLNSTIPKLSPLVPDLLCLVFRSAVKDG